MAVYITIIWQKVRLAQVLLCKTLVDRQIFDHYAGKAVRGCASDDVGSHCRRACGVRTFVPPKVEDPAFERHELTREKSSVTVTVAVLTARVLAHDIA